MRQHLRLALPPLASLTPETSLAFVFVDRDGRMERSGSALLKELASHAKSRPVYAVLHPDDAIVSRVVLPPVAATRQQAAVLSSIEPMVLSDLSQLSVAHGPRSADGAVTVAWASREALRQAWALLAQAGLNLVAFMPLRLVLPADDPDPSQPLGLPAGPRWLGLLPSWSLASDDLRPRSGLGQWRSPLYWACAAAAVWLLGLNVYAVQLRGQVNRLQTSTYDAVAQAFPRIPVIIDPLRQARNERNALRLAQGSFVEDDFMSLAQQAAQVLGFAQGHVKAVNYDKGVLTLTLGEGYTPPANEAALLQAASVQQLLIEKDQTQASVWYVRRLAGQDANRGTPS